MENSIQLDGKTASIIGLSLFLTFLLVFDEQTARHFTQELFY